MKKPLLPSKWPKKDLKKIRGICLDIDETLSTRGKLTAQAYSALWKLKNAGFAVVPITGRPAGWCDHFARFWPVDAVVGENGAFTFFMQDGVRRRIDTPMELSKKAAAEKLSALAGEIRAVFPHAQWASDQTYREYDLAVDFCEDVPRWPENDVEKLLKLAQARGAHAKLSSIHVNIWFGDYDKAKGFFYWLDQGAPGFSGRVPGRDEWLFIGDSPNDEPMFKVFEYSVGVANLTGFLDRLQYPPRWMTTQESGAGFSEMATAVLRGR